MIFVNIDQEFWPDESSAEIDADSVVGLSSERSTSGVHVGRREGHLFASGHNHAVCRAQGSVSGIIAKGACLHESCLLQIGLELCRQPTSHDKLVWLADKFKAP